MADIKYVVFSDMHLGAENSILTNLIDNSTETDNTKTSLVLTKMVACLKDAISKNKSKIKPTLILNGDIIELALTTTNNASMAFQRFIELIMPVDGESLFADEVFYMAGNHDHNIWERSRNAQYVEYLKSLKTGEEIRDEIHTTDLFDPIRIDVSLLNVLFHRYPHLKNVRVTAAYPAHGLLSANKDKCVIVCHGHYVESMYSLMTSLRSKIFPDRLKPQNFEELESENFGWVDFFWSTLGRSGTVGKDINLIYDKLQDPEEVKILISNIAESFVDGKKNKTLKWMEKEMLIEILTLTLGRLAASERNEPETVLTPDATEGLKIFLEHYILNHIKDELGGNVPSDVAFVFGHTHKPFQQILEYDGYKNPVKIYNGGGWVVDTMNQQPLHGGSIVLIDECLDVVSLQMYREGKESVTVEDLKDSLNNGCDFYEQIAKTINMNEEPWSGFAAIAAAEVRLRYKNLASIAKSDN